jgi:hypothetical protein
MSSDDVVFFYDASANPSGDHYAGVPLRNLTQADLESLPEWLRRSIEDSPFYRKAARPKADKAVRPSEDKGA